MVVEKLVDAMDDIGVGAPKISGGEGERKGECTRRTATEADVGGDLGVLDERHVLDEEPRQTLLLANGCGRIVPEAREVGGEGQDLAAVLVVRRAGIILGLLFVASLRVGEGAELGVPVGLEGIGDQTVVGIDATVAAFRQLRFVAGALYVLAPESVHLVGPAAELVANLKCDIESDGGNAFDKQATDRLVDAGSGHPLADGIAARDVGALTHVHGSRSGAWKVVTHRHALAAAPAQEDPLQ